MREIKFRATYNGREYNVETRLPKIIRHPRYKGFYKIQGYIMRLITEHPFANKRGYVPEHRLVMEAYLKRFLIPAEKIHHRDQDRENNNLDNLELFGNQHQHAGNHLRGKRNPHGQFISEQPIFSEIKFRLFNKNTQTIYHYSLATLIGTTFRNGQFEFRGRHTGLKDKNGKEIYEGDIVREDYDWFEKHFTDIFVVEIPNIYYAENDDNHPLETDKECEVIGNIYESPELNK